MKDWEPAPVVKSAKLKATKVENDTAAPEKCKAIGKLEDYSRRKSKSKDKDEDEDMENNEDNKMSMSSS
jgi:hypothetical protein